jgi:myosin heavy subunit
LVAMNEERDQTKKHYYEQMRVKSQQRVKEREKSDAQAKEDKLNKEIEEIQAELNKDKTPEEAKQLAEKKEKIENEKLALKDHSALLLEISSLKKSLNVVKQHGMLPEVASFKRFLGSIKALSTKKIRCFISYAWNQNPQALQERLKRIKTDLVEAGIEVMLDIDNMEGDIDQYMLEGIKKSDRVLLIYTPKFVARAEQVMPNGEINNLQKELYEALAQQKVNPNFIIPLMLEGSYQTSISKSLPNILYLDFSNPSTYYKNMTSLSPKGLIPMLLGLENNSLYEGFLHGFNAELQLFELKLK